MLVGHLYVFSGKSVYSGILSISLIRLFVCFDVDLYENCNQIYPLQISSPIQ